MLLVTVPHWCWCHTWAIDAQLSFPRCSFASPRWSSQAYVRKPYVHLPRFFSFAVNNHLQHVSLSTSPSSPAISLCFGFVCFRLKTHNTRNTKGGATSWSQGRRWRWPGGGGVGFEGRSHGRPSGGSHAGE